MNGDYYVVADATGIRAYLFIDRIWIQVSEKLFALKGFLDVKPYNGNQLIRNEYCSLLKLN